MSEDDSSIEVLREALRPFASIVGKRGAVVTIKIGDDTWSNVITTAHFEAAYDAYHSGQPAYEAWKKRNTLEAKP